MLKTPVSILQELMTTKKVAAPDYQTFGTGQSHCMSFTCHVKANNETAVGVGNTKKDAKQDAAKNLLNIFGVNLNGEPQMSHLCLLPSKTGKLEGPIINYIGKLNEFCSGNRYPPPTYTESLTLQNGQFCVICNFNDFKTEGCGLNKKEAKQDSARKMLNLIKDGDVERILVEAPVTKLEQNSEICDQVLKKYTELMKNVNIDDKEHGNNNIEIVDKEVKASTWAELTEFFNKHGYAYEVTTFQERPLILSLKVNEHVLMQHGGSKEEVLHKFVESVKLMIKEGVDFSKPLVDL